MAKKLGLNKRNSTRTSILTCFLTNIKKTCKKFVNDMLA